MKKLLNISVIAALAILPLAANAEVGDAITGADPTHSDATSGITATAAPKYALATEGANDGNVATANYVKGAYNAAIKAINKVSETANSALQASDITSGAGNGTIAVNGTDVSVTGLGSAAFVNTGDLADTANTYDNTGSGLTATTIQDAIDEIAGTAGSAVQSVTAGTGNGTIAVDGTDVSVTGLGSAAFVNTGDLADTANTYDNTGSGLTATTIQDAIDELADNAGDYATQTAVENTIETATITATVPTLTTWGNDSSTSTVGVTVSSIAATYAEPSNP